MYISFEELQKSLDPLDKATNTNIFNALTICSSVKVPSDFPKEAELRSIPNTLNTIMESLNANYKSIDKQIEELILAEKKNLEIAYQQSGDTTVANKLSSLNSLIDERNAKNQEREIVQTTIDAAVKMALSSNLALEEQAEQTRVNEKTNSDNKISDAQGTSGNEQASTAATAAKTVNLSGTTNAGETQVSTGTSVNNKSLNGTSQSGETQVATGEQVTEGLTLDSKVLSTIIDDIQVKIDNLSTAEGLTSKQKNTRVNKINNMIDFLFTEQREYLELAYNKTGDQTIAAKLSEIDTTIKQLKEKAKNGKKIKTKLAKALESSTQTYMEVKEQVGDIGVRVVDKATVIVLDRKSPSKKSNKTKIVKEDGIVFSISPTEYITGDASKPADAIKV